MAPEDTNHSDTNHGDTSDSGTVDSNRVERNGVDTASPSESAEPSPQPEVAAPGPDAASEPVSVTAPPRKRAPRATKSATKKAAAPQAGTEGAAAARTAKKATSAKATTSRPPRATRSVTKKAAGSAVQDVLPSSDAEITENAETTENTEITENTETVAEVAPVKRAVRKRATRKQAAPDAGSDVREAVAVPAPESSSERIIDPLGSVGSPPATGLVSTGTDEPEEAEEPQAPEEITPAQPAGPPALSVLFQAPDTASPAAKAPAGRRRRAAAPAGAPGTHETAVVVTPEQPVEQPVAATPPAPRAAATSAAEATSAAVVADAEAGDVADGTTEVADGAETSETTERPSRRSRSNRGGRSRRGRDSSDAGGGAGPLAAEDVEDAGDARSAESTTDDGVGGRREPSDSHDAADSSDPEQPDDDGSGPSDDDTAPRRSRRRRGGKGRRGRGGSDEPETESAAVAASATGSTTRADSEDAGATSDTGGAASDGGAASSASDDDQGDEESASSRRRRRRRRSGGSTDGSDESPHVSTRVRQPRAQSDEPMAVRGSTRLEAKKQRRREGREAGRRRTIITEAEFLARREAVDRVMVVRNKDGRTQMGVLEDGVLVEHYIDQATNVSMAGNIYLGRVQNVLPSMEAAFVDIGKGRNAVLYAGEVNWDAAGLEGNQPKRIEHALGSGQAVLVQVTKDPIGHKGARLTSQISLPGRYLVYVPNSSMTGISRKLPDTERARLKKILRDVVPESAGVIVRTAAEGATEDELRADVERLTTTWEAISSQAEAATNGKAGKSKGRKKNGGSGSVPVTTAPALLHGEPDLTVRVIRDVFNEDFSSLVVSGDQAWEEIHPYITSVAPDLADRVTQWTGEGDLFTHHRVDEQLAKAMDRKVWLPSGGSLVIDRTEAMTVVDVNTGKFVGSGGNLEETVTKNNIEAAEEIVRQLRLRDIGGIIVVDFIDMVLESNRDLVVRRLLECLGRDRTKHQVAEVTSLGLVQMTRKRVGSGLIEVFGETCSHCNGRGFIIHSDPVDRGAASTDSYDSGAPGRFGSGSTGGSASTTGARGRRGTRSSDDSRGGSPTGAGSSNGANTPTVGTAPEPPRNSGPTAAQIAAAAHAAALKTTAAHPVAEVTDVTEVTDVAEAAEVAEVTEVTEVTVSIAHDLAAELASEANPTGIDRVIEAEISSTPDTTPPAVLPAVDRGDGSDDGNVRPAEQTPVTQAPAPGADSSGGEAPAARPRRRRGRVMAPAGPPRPAGTEGDHQGGAPQ